MVEDSQDGVISLVNSIFNVEEFTKTEFTLQFKINNSEFQTKFEDLARALENMSYVCKVVKNDEGILIEVQKFTIKKPRKWLNATWTPRILFAIVIGFVMIDGYYRTSGTNSIVEIGEPFEMAIVYTLALLGIFTQWVLGSFEGLPQRDNTQP